VHGGGTHIAFAGQQEMPLAWPVWQVGTEPWVTACLNAWS
jgi:hypothetical protein